MKYEYRRILMYCLIYHSFETKVSAMSISGYPAPIWPTKVASFGWPTDSRSLLPIGMLANQTISNTTMARKKIAWNSGTAMAKV